VGDWETEEEGCWRVQVEKTMQKTQRMRKMFGGETSFWTTSEG
jgi:hypothetical protein